MATRTSAGRAKPPALSKSGARRSTSQKVRFLRVADDNCDLNALALIEKAKASATFGNINWGESEWDLSAFESQRGHKQRAPKLLFTAHLRGHGLGSRTGEPFSNESRFADLVKAIIRLRAEIGGQGATNQQELIIAFRYVYDELVAMGTTDLKQLKRENLDAAAKKVQTRETEVSTYKRVQRLEEIARLLDENGLVIAKLDWRCSWNARPGSMRHGLLEEEESDASTKKSKLPTDGIIEAVAYLYHHIPKSEWADRVRICLVSLLVILIRH